MDLGYLADLGVPHAVISAGIEVNLDLSGGLLIKLVLFILMLGLAAANRWRLTPALDRAIADGAPPPGALVVALSLETLFGAGVLALVSWLGTLSPPAH